MFIGTWWSIVPPILAITLALITKEVYVSLFAGVLLGALFVAGFHPWETFDTLFTTMADSIDLNIVIFLVLLGMVVALMTKSGGSKAYGDWASQRIKTKKGALLATTGLGCLISLTTILTVLQSAQLCALLQTKQNFPCKACIHNRLNSCSRMYYRTYFKLGCCGKLIRT